MGDTTISTPAAYADRIRAAIGNCLVETDLFPRGKTRGKVRDRYDLGDRLALVTTDRQSAFDRVLAAIPFKGQVLNLTSAWWFEQTRDIIPNHVLTIPDPNVTIARKCDVFPIEFVVRGYITGSTSTSLWTVYKNGAREYCGNVLPEGLRKNQRLAENLLTPTTKDDVHDRPIAPDEIVAERWMTAADWGACREAALALFAFGQRKAADHGLILVDTKYEMGRAADGRIVLIDEIHTPDSSRYWLAASYEQRMAAGLEPENVDKEFLRLWFADHCDPYNDAELPPAPDDLVVELSRRYVFLYEKITGERFAFPDPGVAIEERIRASVVRAG
jgi:phosphoribosylaminoimidazole-succinocarboxamide synthase